MQPSNPALSNRYLELRKSPLKPDWKLQSCAVALAAICFLAFSSVALARGNGGNGGNNGGNMSGQNSHGNQGHDPFWSPWHPGFGGSYDSSYCYTPTPEQAAIARKKANDYLLAVQKGRRRAATHRYIAVETLKPTKKQLADYLKKRAGSTQSTNVNPNQLRCMMVFDVQSKQFVGSGCYVVESLPSVGTVAKFDTFSAEYVGTAAL